MLTDDRLEFVEGLREALHANPQMRIGQVLVNALGEDPYYMSNSQAAAAIKAAAAGRWKKT